MNRRSFPTGNEPTASMSLRSLAHDLVELSELQVSLLVLDLKAATYRIRLMAILGSIGLVFFLACIPVALFALAAVFTEQYGWSESLALAVAAAAGLGVSLVFLVLSWSFFRRSFESLHRSREEMHENVDWLKASLAHDLRHSSPSGTRATNGSTVGRDRRTRE